jgi:hypothetical protein
MWTHPPVLVVIASHGEDNSTATEESRESLPQVTERIRDLVRAGRHLGLFGKQVPRDHQNINVLFFTNPRDFFHALTEVGCSVNATQPVIQVPIGSVEKFHESTSEGQMVSSENRLSFAGGGEDGPTDSSFRNAHGGKGIFANIGARKLG